MYEIRETPTPIIQNLVLNDPRHQGRGYSNIEALKPEEYCAAHLATLTETAWHQLQLEAEEKNTDGGGGGAAVRSSYGIAVNYDQLPQILYEHILPHHIGIPVTSVEIDNINRVSEKYSKGRGDRSKQVWQEDSTAKEEGASPAIRQAAQQFLSESYQALQQLSNVASTTASRR